MTLTMTLQIKQLFNSTSSSDKMMFQSFYINILLIIVISNTECPSCVVLTSFSSFYIALYSMIGH